MATTADKVDVLLDKREPKKRSVRFSTADEDAPLRDLYVPKETLKKLDRLDAGSIRVTIEAA